MSAAIPPATSTTMRIGSGGGLGSSCGCRYGCTSLIIRGFIMDVKRLVVLSFLFGCGSSTVANDAGPDASPSDGAPADVSTNDATEAGGTPGPTIGGCPMFPASYPYNVDISAAKLDTGSATFIANLKARAGAIVAEYPGDEYVNV